MLGILCGLESEARIARRIVGARVACAAARPQKGRDLVRELVMQGATRLMSLGIAGALGPSIKLGDVFIGTRVVSETGAWDCDDAWGGLLAARISGVQRGGVYGSEKLVATAQEKAALYAQHGCAIVDMESQCVAEVAAEQGIPFTVIRAVCDDATMNVPPLVMAAVGEDGGIRVGAALASIAANPAQFIDLFRMARGTHRALAALRKTPKSI
ncbi:MAG: hypothetical protein KGI37_10770 [Alphaproteobacteria bacterium]|nr:hypothetical protein [Alphaproteobacteria bacterium]